MTDSRRHGRNFVSVFGAEIAQKLFAAVFFVYLNYSLAGDAMAWYGAFVALFPFLVVLINAGYSDVAVREIAQDRARAGPIVASAQCLQAIFLLPLAAGVYGVLVLLDYPGEFLWILVAGTVAAFFMALSRVQFAVFAAHERFEYPSAISVAVRGSYIVAAIGLLQAGGGVLQLVILLIPFHAVQWAVALRLTGRVAGPVHSKVTVREMIFLIRNGFPIAAGGVAATWFFAMDLPLLLALGLEESAANYAVAMRFLIMLITIPDALAALYYPAFSRKAADSHADQAGALLMRLRLGLLFGFPTAVGVTVLSRPITALIAGEAYAGAAAMLATLTWLLLIETVSRTLGVFLRAHSLQKEFMYVRVGSTLLKFGLAVPVVKAAGVDGLLALSLGSAALCVLATFYFTNKALPLPPIARDVLSVFLRPAAAAIAMGTLLWPIAGYALYLTIPAGVLAFSAFACACRAIRRSDWLIIASPKTPRSRKDVKTQKD